MSEEKGTYNIDTLRRENAVLRKYAAIQKAAEDKIGCQTIYIDMTGDLAAAFVLDEIIFFTLPKGQGKSALRVWKEGSLWMAVQRAEWWERKRLTPRQADSAIDKLEALGLIVKKVFKFNGQTTTHLRLNVPKFFQLYTEELEKQNPPENQDDTITKDIDELYEMMGINRELQNGDSPNGETELPNGETELPNGDSINIPHHPSHNLKTPLSIENSIFAGVEITDIEQEQLRTVATRQFENALGFSKSLPWWDGNKDWRRLGEWVCSMYEHDTACFGEYNIWRNTKYTKGGMTNSRIRGFPSEFYDSWDMFTMATQLEHPTDAPRHEPIPERIRTPRPANVPPPRLGGLKRD